MNFVSQKMIAFPSIAELYCEWVRIKDFLMITVYISLNRKVSGLF